MTETLVHRGPDQSGVTQFRRAALGNRRLKIIDLRAGHQPMSNEDRKVCVTFNGEVYNFRELREQLLLAGHRFVSASDTEVIVHGYEVWGTHVFSHLNGQFAVAVYDDNRHRLVLGRDRLGIKPLYYTVCGGSLVFGSEVKAILAHPDVSARMNPRAVTSYLSYRYPLGNETWYAGIEMLPPGGILVAEGGRVREETFWELPPVIGSEMSISEDEADSQVRTLVRTAVRDRMVSDVPVGAYLSGGLDSSIVVAMMAQQSETAVKTFTVGFGDDPAAEFDFARQVADRYATDHHEIRLDAAAYVELIPELIRFKDAPLSVPNEVPLYAMSRELKKYITVVLSGEGADELFGGYGRIFRSPFDFERMQGLLQGEGELSPSEITGLESGFQRLYNGASLGTRMDHFLWLYSYTPLAMQRDLLTDEFQATIDCDIGVLGFWEKEFSATGALSHYDQYRWLFQRHHLAGLLLRLDTATMATAVEGRVPFVDHQLVEWVFRNVPFDTLIPWRSAAARRKSMSLASDQISEVYDVPKALLRRAFRNELPDDVITRPKVGFPVPLNSWLESELGEVARDVLLDGTTKNRGIFKLQTIEKWLDGNGPGPRLGQIIWMLLNIELWLRSHRVEA